MEKTNHQQRISNFLINNYKSMLATASVVFIFLLSLSTISAMGVTHPSPQNIELKPGQSTSFTFQIQTDDFPVSCKTIVTETGGLELKFEPKYNVESNQRYNVKAGVSVPKNLGYGNYRAAFCVECEPTGQISGSAIIPKFCNLPVTVNAVSQRTGQNMFDQDVQSFITIWITLLIVAIVLLILIIYYLIKRRR